MSGTAADADRVANTIARIFADDDPNNRADILRRLFAETLDFNPTNGTIPLAANDGFPQSAHRIAAQDGINVAYVAITDPGKTRINKSDATSVSQSIVNATGDDPLVVLSNGPNDRLEFVWPVQIGDREELRRIVINREMPQRTAPELVADIYALTQESGSVHQALRQVFTDEAVERPVVPENPTDIFKPHLEPLRRIYAGLANEKATQTKRELWSDMLRGSGFTTGEPGEETELFISHTLLVTIARAVIATMSDWERPEDPASVMAEGFASWPQNRDERGPTNSDGVTWTRQVFHTAATYDWRPRTRDVLRTIYQDLIPKEQRKAFGEYYTPDWLAGMLAERVIDDQWIEHAVERHLHSTDIPTRTGVLDPACGSGTFLYHAAQRIINSDALQQQNATPEQQADFIARMVNGIDIHPIAVEISRATLMRALPAEPTNGVESLQIYQGDALIYTHRAMQLANNHSLPYHTLESTGGRHLRIPTQWAARPGFGQKVMRFVSAANQGQPMPADTAEGLLETDRQTLEATYRTLTEICREEGNSVWAWYIFNSVSPATLKERKVDRILANPPWVRMSNIQVEDRKRELERLTTEMNLWPGGRYNTGFDIAGLFVTRCRELYLTNENESYSRTAWVLNNAAVNGGNWQKVRAQSMSWNEEFLDLAKLKEQPFNGAKSCALIQGAVSQSGPVQTEMLNIDGQRVRRSDDLATVRQKTAISTKPEGFPAQQSDYFTAGKPDFRNGATVFPHVLVRVAEVHGQSNGYTSFTTYPSQRKPPATWHEVAPITANVPSEWIAEICSADDLFAFSTRMSKRRYILPLDGEGQRDPRALTDPFWLNVESKYAERKGAGKNTPQTLWDRVNRYDALTSQTKIALTDVPRKVVYNSSGAWVRAARIRCDLPVVHQEYWYTAKSEDEAAYLVSVLNADCLQSAYQQSRKSDRDFLHHIWHYVPIPRFDAENDHHHALVNLCLEAEQTAAKVRDSMAPDDGKIAVSEAIRSALRENGIARQIDEQVKAILPKHTVAMNKKGIPNWCAVRIRQLRETATEDDIIINESSVEGFGEFIVSHIDMAKPMVTLTPNGIISATWGAPTENHLNIRFLPNGNLAYLLVPHDDHSKVTEWKQDETSPQSITPILETAKREYIPLMETPSLTTGKSFALSAEVT